MELMGTCLKDIRKLSSIKSFIKSGFEFLNLNIRTVYLE